MWHVTPEMWHLARDMWHMVGVEYSLNIPAPQLLWFGIDSVVKIFPQIMNQSII